MNDHVSDQLSAYVDEDLDAASRARIEAHLRECPLCRDEADALRRIVSHASTVAAEDAPPAGDLWSGIAARIERPHIMSLSDAAGRRASQPSSPSSSSRRVSLSIAQLAAAAGLLIAVSGTTAWYLRGSAIGPAAPASAMVQAEVEPTGTREDVRLVNFADAQFDAAVSDLELALNERRNDLNPRTVEILERNLKLIDAAIAQARQALEDDPGNQYLNRHLVESRHRKLELLRRATAITEGD